MFSVLSSYLYWAMYLMRAWSVPRFIRMYAKPMGTWAMATIPKLVEPSTRETYIIPNAETIVEIT